ncbi:MAG TPA: hypothetical protein DEO32_00965 [Ruminococcaceae bacterium]|nr:hypothetical protein [Oscillospiraceae bacterium]
MKSSNRAFFKYLAYALELVLLAVLQSTPRLLPEIFGAKPFLLLALALSVTAFEDFIPSIIFAALCGIISDLNSGGTVGYFAVTLTIVCAVIHYFRGTYLNATMFTFIITSLAGAAAVLILYFIIFRAFGGGSWELFLSRYISRVILTLLASVILYIINGFIHKSFTRKY